MVLAKGQKQPLEDYTEFRSSPTHVFNKLLTKNTQNIELGKNYLFNKWARITGYSYTKKINLNLCLARY